MKLDFHELKKYLDEKVELYNRPTFIEEDPISIPHLFSRKEDIEISGFLSAVIAWGQRKTILANAGKLMEMMDNAPYDFISGFRDTDLKPFEHFVHRTFNGIDCIYFLTSLKNIYSNHGGLENLFTPTGDEDTVKDSILRFRNVFFELPHLPRTQKHIANPFKNASAKRLNMFLRWMVRKDDNGVDFGIWQSIDPALLMCPLDVHTGNVARALGLLHRNQSDWKAVEELTAVLRSFDPVDPVKYDFALFGMGMYEKLL